MKSALLLLAIGATAATASMHAAHEQSLPIHTRHLNKAADYEIQERDYDEFVNLDDRDEHGWEDMDSYGLMMERDVSPVEMSSLQKRSAEIEGSVRTRDLGTSQVELGLDERGNIVFPRSWDDVKDNFQKLTKRVGKTFSTTITWYTKGDLLNPSCCDKSGYTPTDKSLIAAVTLVWPGKPKCGQYLKLRAKNSKKSVVVRVVDSCGGCKPYVSHVDLTRAAFTKLYGLDVGLVGGIQVKKVSAPFAKYSKSKVALFGPKNL